MLLALGGCQYCGSEGDAYFNSLCDAHVGGCGGLCNGTPMCLGL